MSTEARVKGVLSRALEILPSSEEDVVLTGVITKINERMVELKLAEKRLTEKYGSLEKLEDIIKEKGIPLEDHRAYNDLLEWRAIRHELRELARLLESI
jgi:hypothetical protein